MAATVTTKALGAIWEVIAHRHMCKVYVALGFIALLGGILQDKGVLNVGLGGAEVGSMVGGASGIVVGCVGCVAHACKKEKVDEPLPKQWEKTDTYVRIKDWQVSIYETYEEAQRDFSAQIPSTVADKHLPLRTRPKMDTNGDNALEERQVYARFFWFDMSGVKTLGMLCVNDPKQLCREERQSFQVTEEAIQRIIVYTARVVDDNTAFIFSLFNIHNEKLKVGELRDDKYIT